MLTVQHRFPLTILRSSGAQRNSSRTSFDVSVTRAPWTEWESPTSISVCKLEAEFKESENASCRYGGRQFKHVMRHWQTYEFLHGYNHSQLLEMATSHTDALHAFLGEADINSIEPSECRSVVIKDLRDKDVPDHHALRELEGERC